MLIGFGKVEITPRVGVELCGFGPFLLRRSIAVRDPLWARAMAVEEGGIRFVLVSCDLIGVTSQITSEVRRRLNDAKGLPPEALMVHCTHTHSGPGLGIYSGWGEADLPWVETLAGKIVQACLAAIDNQHEATLSHAEVPCEGIGLNREYDKDAPPLADVLRDDWRPAKPELTDRTCHVFKAESAGRCIGFLSYFGCHPVVCCQETRYIHGDFVGVATNLLEQETGGIGLFLQGAQGDVNSCVVHKPEAESLKALDIIAERYARAVRAGLKAVKPLRVESIACVSQTVTFHRKQWGREKLAELLAEHEATVHAPRAVETDSKVRMAMVYVAALRKLLAALDAGKSLEPPTEIQGLRIGPVALLGSPFEIFQAIKNDVVRQAAAPLPLVLGLANDSLGYAVDETAAARGGYAADLVPLIIGGLPYAGIHHELVDALLKLDAALQSVATCV
jgi:hypothetical protein